LSLRLRSGRVALESLRDQADTRVDDGGLRRAFGPFTLTLVGVGNAIGAGIFVLTGTAAALYAGPAITLSYIIAGIACVLTSLCYAEVSALIPSAGGSFTYARVTLGRLPAWLIGWCMVMEYMIAASTVAAGWSGYAQSLLAQLGVSLPHVLTGAPFDLMAGRLVASNRIVDLPAVLMITACTCILIGGLRQSAIANAVMVTIKVAVIIAVIAVGSFYVTPSNWTPFIPAASAAGHFGWGGVCTASAIAFFSYTGFEAMSTAARESRNPTRDLPIALLASIGICIFLYVGTALVLTGLVPYPMLATSSPLSTALGLASPKLGWLITIVNVGTVLGLGAAVLISLYGQTRTFYSMAVAGYLPAAFAHVHPALRTPTLATMWTGIGAAIVAGLLPIELLGELVSMGTLIAFASVCLGVLILRRTYPRVPRPFRIPLYPWIPLSGLLSCVGLMFSLPLITWANLMVWVAIGIVLYFALHMGRRGEVRGHPDLPPESVPGISSRSP
jgi:basic amino acid/polyamine antiporter, APA family